MVCGACGVCGASGASGVCGATAGVCGASAGVCGATGSSDAILVSDLSGSSSNLTVFSDCSRGDKRSSSRGDIIFSRFLGDCGGDKMPSISISAISAARDGSNSC